MKKEFVYLVGIMMMVSGCATTQRVEISKPTDGKLTCEEILAEKEEVNDLISEVKEMNAQAHVAGAGTAVAGHAAMFSGVPGLGVALSQASGLSNMGKAEREQLMRDAESRVNVLNGIYLGKGC